MKYEITGDASADAAIEHARSQLQSAYTSIAKLYKDQAIPNTALAVVLVDSAQTPGVNFSIERLNRLVYAFQMLAGSICSQQATPAEIDAYAATLQQDEPPEDITKVLH